MVADNQGSLGEDGGAGGSIIEGGDAAKKNAVLREQLTWGTARQAESLFVLISQQRSGSKWAMGNIMGAHPAVWMKFMEPLSAKSQVALFGNSSVRVDGAGVAENVR